MEALIAAVIGLLIGGAGVFVVKRFRDESQKKSARFEAEKILNRAKSESAKIDRESKNRAKDFETRARKNVETELAKQKSQLNWKTTSARWQPLRLEKKKWS